MEYWNVLLNTSDTFKGKDSDVAYDFNSESSKHSQKISKFPSVKYADFFQTFKEANADKSSNTPMAKSTSEYKHNPYKAAPGIREGYISCCELPWQHFANEHSDMFHTWLTNLLSNADGDTKLTNSEKKNKLNYWQKNVNHINVNNGLDWDDLVKIYTYELDKIKKTLSGNKFESVEQKNNISLLEKAIDDCKSRF